MRQVCPEPALENALKFTLKGGQGDAEESLHRTSSVGSVCQSCDTGLAGIPREAHQDDTIIFLRRVAPPPDLCHHFAEFAGWLSRVRPSRAQRAGVRSWGVFGCQCEEPCFSYIPPSRPELTAPSTPLAPESADARPLPNRSSNPRAPAWLKTLCLASVPCPIIV